MLSWIGFKDPQPVTSFRVIFVFQSLLSWIGFKDTRLQILLDPEAMVSILVVVDWVQRPACAVMACARVSLFQSLLSWIGFKDCSRLKVDRGWHRVSILVVVDWVQRQFCELNGKRFVWGFNPCCRGLGSKTWAGNVVLRVSE